MKRLMKVTAVLGLGACVALPLRLPAQVALRGVNVRVQMAGSTSEPWESVSGGGFGIQVSEATQVGSDQFAPSSTLGRSYISELTLARPMTSGAQWLSTWLTDAIELRPLQRTVEVGEVPSTGEEGRSWSYMEAFPVRYVFPKLSVSGSGSLREELVIQANRVEDGGWPGPARRSGAVLQNGAGRFTVEIIGGAPLPRPGVLTVSIGDLVVPAIDVADSPSAFAREYMPGQPQFGPVTLTAMAGGNSDWNAWFQDQAQGQPSPRDIRIAILDSVGREIRGFMVRGATPVSYDPSELVPYGRSIVAVETLTLRVDRVELW